MKSYCGGAILFKQFEQIVSTQSCLVKNIKKRSYCKFTMQWDNRSIRFLGSNLFE